MRDKSLRLGTLLGMETPEKTDADLPEGTRLTEEEIREADRLDDGDLSETERLPGDG